MTWQNKITYGIIGFGRHAEKRLAPAFKQSEIAELIAIQKRDRSAVEEKQAAFEIPEGYTDVQALVESDNIDAVIVASPPALHKEQVISAAEAGKHVMVEKPMATHAGECEEMIHACRENSVRFFVAFCMRYIHVVQKTAQLIKGGRLGELRFIDANFVLDATSSTRTWLSDPRLSGGGPVADLGAHLLDLMEYVTGDSIVAVQPILIPPYTPQHIERQAAVAIHLKSGILANLFTSFDLPPQKELTFYGSRAKLSIRNFSRMHSELSITISEEDREDRLTVKNGDHFLSMLDSFTNSILNNTGEETPGELGRVNQRIIDMIYEQSAV